MFRAAALGAAVASASVLGACQSPREPELPLTGSGLTPTEQFGVQIAEVPDRIQLAPRAGAPSPAQVNALTQLARRWSAGGAEAVRIDAPTGGGNAAVAAQAAQAAAQVLYDNGVAPGAVVMGSYDAAGQAAPTIAVGYTRLETVIPDCTRYQADVTKTFENEPSRVFGCAVTANFAAQLADPRDLTTLRPEGPSDGARRAVVLGKYRQGQSTASSRGQDERGTVSDAVQ